MQEIAENSPVLAPVECHEPDFNHQRVFTAPEVWHVHS